MLSCVLGELYLGAVDTGVERMKDSPGIKKSLKSRRRRRRLLSLLLVTFALLFVLSTGLPAGAGQGTSPKKGSPIRLPEGWTKGDGEHYLGLIPTPPGDYPQISPPPQKTLKLGLSTAVDLSGQLPPIGNQGRQGSCVGWATSYYYKSWQEKQEHTGWNLADQNHQYSPAFIYNQINVGRDSGVDKGSFVPDALYVMEKRGDVDIADMPYSDVGMSYATQPTAAQLEAARPYRIPNDWGCFWNHGVFGPYDTPNNIDNIKAWLDSGRMLVVSLPIYGDWPDYGGNPATNYYNYNGYSGFAGGHALCVCGYDDNVNPSGSDADHRGGFKVVNSWGPSWNGTSAGFVYLSYDFVKRYVWEAWASYDRTPDSPHMSSLSTTGGSAGETIHIYGNNFGTLRRSDRVSFNSLNASNVSFTDSDITCTVPSGATTGPVTVYDWEGAASNQTSFTVGAAAPKVTSVNPSYATQDATANVTITGANLLSGAKVRLEKNGVVINASSVSVAPQMTITCSFSLSGAEAGAYDVVVENTSGHKGTLGGGFSVELKDPNILRCSTDSSGQQMLSGNCSMSGDGRYVVFVKSGVYRKDIQTGQTVLCSTKSDGTLPEANFSYDSPVVSLDGRYVAFITSSYTLVPGFTGGYWSVYRKDLATGVIQVCNTDGNGYSLGNSGYFDYPISMSSDGRYVAFACGGSGTWQIIRKDMSTGQIAYCCTDYAGTSGNADSKWPSISSDGRYVAFHSGATNLVGNSAGLNVFRKDLSNGSIVLCSTDSSGNQVNATSSCPSISSDGRYVAFDSNSAALVPDTTGLWNVFRKDLLTGQTLCCSTNRDGVTGDRLSQTPSISSDGAYVAFISNSNYLIFGPSEGDHVYRKNLNTGEIARCSSDAFGEPANYQKINGSHHASISSDGRYVAFDSDGSNLVPRDTNGAADAFRKDCQAIKIPRITGVSPSLGVAGTVVTISGLNFGSSKGTSSVLFGEARAAEFPYWSDTQIQCKVPTGATGEVPLRVVTNQGASNDIQFYVGAQKPKPPTVISITPSSGTVNTSVSITNLAGTDFVSLPKVRLERTGATTINAMNVQFVSGTQITCTLSLSGTQATGAYDVVVKNPDGQEGRLGSVFTVNAASPSSCGGGAAVSVALAGLMFGLLSLTGSGSLRKLLRKHK